MGKRTLEAAFKQTFDKGGKLFVPYIMGGDGGLEKLPASIEFLSRCGASAVEVGVPFSDPAADGPVIQEAGARSLEKGTTMKGILDSLRAFKDERSVPVVLMTYINPILAYGAERFSEDCLLCGVDGVIVPDLPLEEEEILAPYLRRNDIALVRLVSLTSPPDRQAVIASRAEGFLYAVAVNGTTGARGQHVHNIGSHLQGLKMLTDVPVLAGFGISSPSQVVELSSACDGVVAGSKVIELMEQGNAAEVKRLIQSAAVAGRQEIVP